MLLVAGAVVGCDGAAPPPPPRIAIPAVMPSVEASCAPPRQLEGSWSTCVPEAEVRAAMDRKSYFHIDLALSIQGTGKVASAKVIGDGSTAVKECIERRALQMTFEFLIPCPAGVVISQSYSVDSGKAQ